MKKLLPVIPLLLLMAACATRLAPDGAYRGDQYLYQADRAIVSGYDTLHNFVLWEYENREALAKWPEIREFADGVRTNAKGWISSAIAFREAYAARGDKESLDDLRNVLYVLQASLSEASRYMAKPLTK